MTPKEKAEEIVSSMEYWLGEGNSLAKQSALIASDYVIDADYNSLEYYGNLSCKEYWQQVKQEIEKL